MNKVSKSTIIRTAVLTIALLNQFLTITGKSPLPFEDVAVEQFVSMSVTAIAALIAWWKNNSFTAAAVRADRYMKTLQ